jgi:hypothetical protein
MKNRKLITIGAIVLAVVVLIIVIIPFAIRGL